MAIIPSRFFNLLKLSLFHNKIPPVSASIFFLWRRSQSYYKTNLSTRDLVEVVDQKAKIHRYLKPQEPEEDSLHINYQETCNSDQNLDIISENDQLDFGSLDSDHIDQKPYHESLVSRSMDRVQKVSVIDELLTTEPEEDPADCLRLSKVYRRHPPEHYSSLIIRFCKAGDTNSALSVFFSDMLEKDRVLPSRFHAHMLLDGLAKVGDSENAFRVYKKMTELGITASQATYSRLFRSCAEDIATWYRKYKHFIPPIVNHTGNSLSLVQRKNIALQKVLTPDMLPVDFGGPAVNKVYSLWRRLQEKNVPLSKVTYNVLILALAKAGDIHGCMRALDMMLATTNSGHSSHGSVKSKIKCLVPDSFTLASLLSAIEPATLKRNLKACHDRMDPLKQSTSNANSFVYHLSPFQLALSLWHDLTPLLQNNSIVPHHFTLLVNVMALQNDCLNADRREIIFVNNTRPKSFQHLLNSSSVSKSSMIDHLTHPSCTSSELASLMIARAAQFPLVDITSTINTTELDSSNKSALQKATESSQIDWNDTMLALRSPINLLLSTDKPIVISGPKNQGMYPWQRLALVGGLHGLMDIIENHYKLKPGLPFMTSIIRLLPYPTKSTYDDTIEGDFDIWEKEFFDILSRFKLTPDNGIYNALIHRRTSSGVNAKHLLADMTRKGFVPDQITWGCLAHGCKTAESVKQLLNAFEIAAMTPLSSIQSNDKNLAYQQKIHSPVVRPSFTFFSTILSTSGFSWDLKAFVIEYMRRQIHADKLTDRKSPKSKQNVSETENSHQFDGFKIDRRLVASIDIDIGLFRELVVKGVIPKDGSPVPPNKTGGFYVPPNSIRSFYRFFKVYKSWLRESPVAKPR
ncbi:Pentatricopeptide repeat-containing protein 1 [Schistosoma japonicum]|uniref:Pentatricopeptide repeat-containing protein 1 n=1 Tax=Schistosoma japonicum TaxID=6182 RepID=A0A4Z2DR16_SCHJA|nr:Pentatricopeptide repeat-containing protein 1 [Schistosoma japonicum]KAH8849188.1 Pentatricopeptide repeat-containing protein 1 [Schistosoma japonicum]TNN18925.1 Pentatricopeptide repeat-containing protein 1 [Schistosoma japonicum]